MEPHLELPELKFCVGETAMVSNSVILMILGPVHNTSKSLFDDILIFEPLGNKTIKNYTKITNYLGYEIIEGIRKRKLVLNLYIKYSNSTFNMTRRNGSIKSVTVSSTKVRE